MKISDILARKQSLSYEIFPPRGELSCDHAVGIVSELKGNVPDWVSVTFSAGGTGNSQHTVEIARRIQDDLGLTALAHLTCIGASVADVDGYVRQFAETGIENVLALRGDRIPGREPIDFSYAVDLIAHLRGTGLCIGAACYPEGHVECEEPARSMEHLKAKQDAGADFLVTQLFFDNELFYRFREEALKARIKIPIVCGIMPFTSVKQIQRMAFTCGATIPSRVIKRLVAVGENPDDQRRAGVEYACEQLCDLAENGVDGLHVYCMNRPDVAAATHDALASCGYLGQ